MNFDTSSMTKILESEFVRFLDTTPSALSPTWALVGAVEEDNAQLEYNPNVERIKYIVDKGSRTNHKSNDKQMSVPLQAYKGDNLFAFIDAGRDKLNYKTRLLEVDLWDKNNGSYKAKMSDATISITSYNGQLVEFDVYVDGDPTEGTVTLSGQTPTFVATTSL